MAKKCVHCDGKIGFFQKAVEKVYCSERCSEAAQAEMLEQQREADRVRDEAKLKRAAEAEQEQADKENAKQHAQLLATCPKCEQPWRHTPPATDGAAHQGACKACGLEAEFANIEPCDHCRATSMLVALDGSARCPRCRVTR